MDPIEQLQLLRNALGFTGPDGQSHGREVSIYNRDALDDVVDNYVAQAVERHLYESEEPPQILDIGGGTGNRGEQFAKMGAGSVLITGLSDCSDEVFARNQEIGREALRFKKQDIREAKAEDLTNNVFGGWSLIQMRRVLHWMPWSDVAKVLTFLPKISGSKTQLAMCVTHWPKSMIKKYHAENPGSEPFLEDNYRNYRAEQMTNALRKAGYKILYKSEEPTWQGAISCQYFAEMPRPR